MLLATKGGRVVWAQRLELGSLIPGAADSATELGCGPTAGRHVKAGRFCRFTIEALYAKELKGRAVDNDPVGGSR